MKSQAIEMNKPELNHQPKAIDQKEKRTMKSHLRIVTLSLLGILSLAVLVVPVSGQSWQCPGTPIYNSNPNPWQSGGWWLGNNALQIGGPATPGAIGQPPWPTSGPNSGVSFGVSQPFTFSSAHTVSCLEFLVWEYPGSSPDISTLYWSLDNMPFGAGTSASPNTNYGSGTANQYAQLQQQNPTFTCPTNQYGYAMCVASIKLPPGGLNLGAATYYLTLTLGMPVASGDPLYWDQYLTTGSPVSAWQRPPLAHNAGTMTFAIY